MNPSPDEGYQKTARDESLQPSPRLEGKPDNEIMSPPRGNPGGAQWSQHKLQITIRNLGIHGFDHPKVPNPI